MPPFLRSLHGKALPVGSTQPKGKGKQISAPRPVCLAHLALLPSPCYPFRVQLTPQQVNFLSTLRARGFDVVAFPLYENFVGVRKGNCGALLAPNDAGTFQLYGEPSYLVSGQPSARMIQSDGHWFVRRGEKIPATLERSAELANALLPVA